MDRNEAIKSIVELLVLLADNKEKESKGDMSNPAIQTVEMLTIPECLKAVSGISESTLRKLIRQGKIPSIRAGEGKNGKILVNKGMLIDYFSLSGDCEYADTQ